MDRIYTFDDLENIQRFVRSLKRKAKKLKITLQLTNDKFVILSDDIECQGFFSDKQNKIPGVLATATNKSINSWLSTLVHESCHMDQWSEKVSIWEVYMKEDIDLYYYKWINNKRVNKNKVYRVLDICRELELDCEQRAVQKIIKYNLPIDVKEYIQKANCCLFFYSYLKLDKNGSLPNYDNVKVYTKFKDDWYIDYDDISNNILKLFKNKYL